MRIASIADPALSYKRRHRTDLSFTFAGLQTPAYGQPSLATAGLHVKNVIIKILNFEVFVFAVECKVHIFSNFHICDTEKVHDES